MIFGFKVWRPSGVSEMDIIIHIIHSLPQEYETIIEFLENEIKMETSTLERVRKRLRMKFDRISKSIKENEKALVSFQKYKGNCTCGIYGHNGADCQKRLGKVEQSKSQDQNGGPNKKGGGFSCYVCHETGHLQDIAQRKRRTKEG
jgi:heme exporter protein D